MADVNGDGKLDLLIGASEENAFGFEGFAVQLGNGDGTFQAPVAVAANNPANNIVAADVNGDGKLDVIIGTSYYASVFLGNGDGTFQAEADYGNNATGIAVGDVNGDGKLDIVTVGLPYLQQLDVLVGNGDGTFQSPVPVGASGTFAALADMNGDGKLDIVTGTPNGSVYNQGVSVFLGNGDGTFQTPETTQFNNFVFYISVADLNNDGKLDLVAVDYYGFLYALLGNGDGTFQINYLTQLYNSVQPAVGDVNGDGKLDIVAPLSADSVAVFPGNGDGTFGNAVSYPTGTDPTWAVVGDINSDGKPDLALVNANGTGSTTSILLNQVTQTATLTGVTLPGAIADKVTGTYSGDANYSAATTNTLLLASHPGTGTATLAVSPTSGVEGTLFTLTAKASDAGTAITAGSFAFYDGVPTDGDNLIATVQIDAATGAAAYETRSLKIGTHQLYAVFTGTDETKSATAGPVQATVTGKYATTTALASTGVQGSYAFSAVVDAFGLGTPTGSVVFTDESTNTTLGTVPLTAATLTSSFLPAAQWPTTGDEPGDVVAGDFNGDGKVDLAVCNMSDNTVGVLLGNGDGTFAEQITTAAPSRPEALASGDFNGDGKLDLAVVDYYANAATILLGNGDGTFQTAASLATGTNPYSVAVADFNGDGKPDLVVGNYYDAMVSVFLGNGDGTFGAANTFGSNFNGVYWVAVGDLNGDGRPDIVTANGPSLGVFLGKGDGSFGAEVDYGASGTTESIVAVDVNLDGKLDLVAGGTGGYISVLLGNGDGTFQAQQNYPSANGSSFYGVEVADFNGDGNPDIVASNYEVSAISVLLGNGTAGTFQPAQMYNVGSYPYELAVADFNDDGRPDIASENYQSDNVSILLGAAAEGVSLAYPTLPGSFSDEVVAAYTGDPSFAASVSNTLTLPSHPLATKTTLAATPTSAALGAVVALTATVTDSDSKPVTRGSASFYNGTTLLQTVQLAAATNGTTNAGTATLKLADLPVGANSITAQFAGTVYDTASASAAKTVTITGKYPTTTALTVAGTSGNYTLTGTVTSGAIANPTGSVVFTDTTASPNVVIGTATLSAASLTPGFQTPVGYGVGGDPVIIKTADFNNDGKLDLAIAADDGDSSIYVLLGNGDGTFATAQALGAAHSLDVADVNRDGLADIVALTDGGIVTYLGNGDGTFQTASPPTVAINLGYANVPILDMGDLNGDGYLDVVVPDYNNSQVWVLLGNGDGSFRTAQSYPGASSPLAVVVRDFNGDGKLDVATTNSGYGTISIFFGNGDGTLQTAQTVGGMSSPEYIFSADVNGDGKPDIAVSQGGSGGTVFVLLNQGGGNFAAAASYTTNASQVYGMTLADVTGDGVLDIVAPDSITGNIEVLAGNGDGTFQSPVSFSSGFSNSGWVTAGDYNSDGRTDLAAAGFSAGQVGIMLGDATETATLTNAAVYGSGSSLHNVVATYSGDTHFTGSTSPAQQLTASPAAATLTLADEPGASEPYGTAASVLATVAGPAGAPTPTGSVSYTVDGGAAQTATLSGGSATLALGSSLSVAKHTIAATYSGDTIYGKVTQSISLTIVKANQTVSFNNTIGNQTYGAGPFGVSATATSGLAATVSVVSGPATISGTTLTLTGAGTVVLQAAQPGNADYNAAPTVQQSFAVAKAPLAVVVANATKVYGSANPAFSSTITGLVGSDTVTVAYSTTATTTSPVGTYTVNATLSGAALANYTPTITNGTLTITKQPLTVTVANASRNYGAANPAFSATITGLQGTDTATATFSTTATATSAVGAYSITATVTGSDLGNYNVTVVNGTLTVAPAPLTITVANATKVYGQANPAFTSTLTGVENGDTVPVAYSTSATNTTGVGSYQITASTTDANYAATVVPGTLTITKATLTIAVNSLTKVYGSANPAFTGTVTGLLFNDTVTTTYTTTAAQYSYVGAYPITASISGGASANYNAVVTNGTLTVTQALLTIVVNNGTKVYGTANPAFTGTVTGILNHDAVVVTYSSPATAATTVGSYANIGAAISGGPAVNYNTKVTDGTLTITPAPLTATVNPATKTYGAANPAFATTFVGLVNGDTLTSTYSTTATAASPVGSYTVGLALSGALLPNYTPTIVSGTLTVTKATLTVTAANASAAYGTAIPSFTYSIAGFVNGDPASVVTGTASETTTAAQGSAVGTYPIAVSQGTLAAANYGFAFVAGTLTIVVDGTSTALAASPNPSASGQAVTFTATVTAASGPTPTGGTVTFTHGGVAYPAVSLVNGVATLTTAADLTPGTHSIRAVYSGSATDAASTSAALTQTVLIATTTAIASTPNPSTTGQAVTFTATVTAASGATPTGTVTFTHGGVAYPAVTLVNGVATLTTSADLTAGTHTIRAIYAGSATDATSTSAPLTQTVNAP